MKFFKRDWVIDKLSDVIIVIFSITIAFQLNSWKERSQQNKKTENILSQLKSDIQSDGDRIQQLIKGHEKKVKVMENYLQLLNDKKMTGQQFFEMHQVMNSTSSLTLKKTNYNVVLSTGDLYLIHDKDLMKDIIEYYNSEKESEFYEKNEIERLNEFNTMLFDEYLLGSNELPQKVIKTIGFKNVMLVFNYNLQLKIGEYKQLLNRNKKLLEKM
ncbi:hypothetical protein KMW28_24080 [Flammeovirga yaeyamensis]|uniref:Uncharacterized protein n=1 Tax=Flammeovirga yaeyamensis TaxID=367791 RepID=A0AAX1NF31_9BACT|nr:hypothetical protein [Flammeovirga yaeyamensis]MBB3696540.1 hypothetical protein [Flammeovirga yaeyamensis]NMF33219.1 hypothetical protein [Flammeovirga yaeyamensis]QWG05501.1 hypothetical protein KMW28_24080 [Flammeovirga yaeyamensis]